MMSLRLSLAAAAIALAAPLAAQTAPPAASPAWGGPGGPGRHDMRGGGMDGMNPMAAFDALSPEGRKIMTDAMASARDQHRADHDKIAAAREKMLAVLEADKLDVTALKRAMDEEQATSNAARDRMQAAMISGFTKLSVQDRKAFAAYARAMRNRMQARMERWEQMRGKRGAGGMDGMEMMPPPPPPKP
jgi:uncharacterized membrane protein